MSGADHDGLRQVGAEVRDAQRQDAGADRLRQRAAVVAAATAAATTRPPIGWAWAGVGALALAAAALLWSQAGATAVGGGSAPTVAAPMISSPPGSDGRLEQASLTPPKARNHSASAEVSVVPDPLELASGTVEIAPDGAREVVAGPYRIDVGAGDRVAFTWDSAEQLLEVRVEAGAVDLHLAVATHTITAGHQARVQGSGVVITSTRAIAEAPGKTEKRKNTAWKRLAKDGRYAEALAQAKRARALKQTASAPKADLKLLADVARLGGAPAQSTAVLQTLRRRFPKSREARRAAFYLGRQAEREARLADAASWYRTYLEGTTQGSLRAEARGRLLGVLRRQGESSAARTVAREVLQDDPNGAYVDLARKSLGGAP